MAAIDDRQPAGSAATPPGTLSRRQLLRRAGALGGAAVFGGALASLLAACGGGTTASPTTSTSAGGSTSTTTIGGASTPAAAGAATPSGAASSSTATTAGGPIQRGGTMTWAYTAPPMKLDPVWTQALVDGTVLSQIVDALGRANKDGSAIEPALAQKWDVSADGLTYTYHLRPSVKFHDGSTMTADDVVASLNRNKTMGSYMWQLQEAQSIDKVDDQTVKVTLTTKVASFVARMATISNGIFPASQIQQTGKNEFTNPIGTGPFKLKEWVRNDHLTLDKNPNYWDNAPDGQPYPYLDEIIIKQVAEDTTQVLQVQAGQLNGGSAPYSQVATLKTDGRGQIAIFPQQQVYFMVVQVTKPPFDDVKVRQALSLALDRKALVDRVTAGTAQIANSFFPKGTLDWDPTLSLPFDVNQAKQLISQSKYASNAPTAKLQFPSGSTVGHDNAVLVQQMWQQVGINTTLEQVESSTLAANWYKGDFESISGYQWTNGMADPDQLVEFFFVTPRMNSGYQPSQQASDLATQAAQELDPNKRQQDYFQIQQTYNQDVGGTISLYYTVSVNYLSKNVRDFYRSPLGQPWWWTTWLAK